MKKNVITYISTLSMIFITYFIASLILALLYQHTTISSSIYNTIILICSYGMIVVGAIFFSFNIKEKVILHALLFTIIFLLFSIICLMFKVNWISLFIKIILFIAIAVACNFIKK